MAAIFAAAHQQTGQVRGGPVPATVAPAPVDGRHLMNGSLAYNPRGDPRVQAPAPDTPAHPEIAPPFPRTAGAATAPAPTALPAQRVVIAWGPNQDTLVVGLETAPDWELEFSGQVAGAAVVAMLPLIARLARVKDLTGLDLLGRFRAPPPIVMEVPTHDEPELQPREGQPAADVVPDGGYPDAVPGNGRPEPMPTSRKRGRRGAPAGTH